jgi:hypothetical protein
MAILTDQLEEAVWDAKQESSEIKLPSDVARLDCSPNLGREGKKIFHIEIFKFLSSMGMFPQKILKIRDLTNSCSFSMIVVILSSTRPATRTCRVDKS